MRELTELERANAAFLTANDVPYGLLEVTRTGLEKSILDATQTYREFLQTYAIHDFDRQAQGPDFKVMLPAALMTGEGRLISSRASLYRPVTKTGDPRVWFKELPKVVRPGEIFASIWAQKQIWAFNISALDVAALTASPGAFADVVGAFVRSKSGTVATLLDLVRGVASKGFIKAPVRGSTAVGRLLESELGIAMNSRNEPDFQGIEIKASRGRSTRVNLFAKTPDWGISRYAGSRALLAAFGYEREDRIKLYTEVDGRKPNSLGFSLVVNEGRDIVQVFHSPRNEDVVTWQMDVLRHSLSVKHDETFWVKADTKLIDGDEYIRFTGINHTRKPILAQLSPLLSGGVISMDFTISSQGQQVHDKGYLFKIWPRDLSLLFPPSVSYALPISDAVSLSRVARG